MHWWSSPNPTTLDAWQRDIEDGMMKVAKFVTLLVILVGITAILHLTDQVASHEPMWVYWTFLAASIVAGVWLINNLRR
jgi:hypothetical protein